MANNQYLWQDYLASDPNVANIYGNTAQGAFQHYLDYGRREGRPSPLNWEQYLRARPDVEAAYGWSEDAAIRHYINSGAAEGMALPDSPAYIPPGYTYAPAAQSIYDTVAATSQRLQEEWARNPPPTPQTMDEVRATTPPNPNIAPSNINWINAIARENFHEVVEPQRPIYGENSSVIQGWEPSSSYLAANDPGSLRNTLESLSPTQKNQLGAMYVANSTGDPSIGYLTPAAKNLVAGLFGSPHNPGGGYMAGPGSIPDPTIQGYVSQVRRAEDEAEQGKDISGNIQAIGNALAVVGGAYGLVSLAESGTGAYAAAQAANAASNAVPSAASQSIYGAESYAPVAGEVGTGGSAGAASMYGGEALVPSAGEISTVGGAGAAGSEVASGAGLSAWQSGALGGSGGAAAGTGAAATTAGITGLGLAAGAVPGTAGLTAGAAGAGAGLAGLASTLTSGGGAMGLLGDVLPSVIGAGTSIYGYKEYADAMKEAARMQVEQADRALAAQQQALQQTIQLQQQAVAQGRQDIAAQLQPQIQALQQGAQNAMAQYQQAAQQAQTSVDQGYSQAEQAMRQTGQDVASRSTALTRDLERRYGDAAAGARADLTGQSQAAQSLYGQGMQNYLSQLGQGAQQARTDIGAGYQQAIGALDPYAAGARQSYDAALQGALNPNSDLYRMQQEDLEKSINRQAAARGLYGSGASMELQANQMRRLAAEEAQRRYERQVQMSQVLPAAAQAQSQLQAQQGQTLGDLAFQQGQLGAGAQERGYSAMGTQAAQLGGQLADVGMQSAQLQGGAQQAIGLGNIGTQAQVGLGLGEMAGQKGIYLARIYASLGQQAGSEQAALSRNLASIYGDYGTNMANIQTAGATAQQRALQGAADQTSNIYTGLGEGLSENRALRGQALSNLYGNLGGTIASFQKKNVIGQQSTGLYPWVQAPK